MNRVILAGRLTRDPELRTSPNGVNFTSFSIAVNRQMPNAQGERVADFINCVAFNKQAENLVRFIRKGGLIGVDGKLQTRQYQAQDGTNRYATEVICDSISFLETKSASNGGMNQDYSSYEPAYNQQPQVNQQRSNYQNNGYSGYGQQPSNNYQQNGGLNQNNYQQQSSYPQFNQAKPAYEQNNNLKEVAKQFEITDDDLPSSDDDLPF